MKCYKCGFDLSEHDFCTACGADVSVYKKIIASSNKLYNDGLEKAKVRDLSGAITSLRQCVRLNSHHVEARNLLGLIYFETGEVVAAFSEWVLSLNERREKNIASDYIDSVQSNPTRLDTINQTIKKYNLALNYCNQEAYDLAVIQLKKVLSMNPNFIRARLLIALLYLKDGEWEKAQRELLKCKRIDRNNTTTLRYLQEAEDMLAPVEGVKNPNRRKRKEEEIVKYQSGNETIIQPVDVKDHGGAATLVNLAIGLAIGLAAAWFLILPARIQNANAKADEQVKAVSEQLDVKTATIDEMQHQIENLEREKKELDETINGFQGADGKYVYMDFLMQAAQNYLENPEDLITIGDSLGQIDVNAMEEGGSESAMSLYDTLVDLLGPSLAETYYNEGYSAYNNGDYNVAIIDLDRAYQYNHDNADALYYLAQAYNKNNDLENARKYYQLVMDYFPDTDKATKAESYLAQIQEPEDVMMD